MSALGQDIQWWSTDVRFTLESRHGCAYRDVRFVPIADITHRSERSLLFDHLIGDGKHPRGDGNAKSLGGLEVDQKLKCRRLLDRQVAGACAFKNPVHI